MVRQILTIKNNPIDGLKTINIKGTKAEPFCIRPANSSETIQRELSKSDCFSCGKCCKKINHGRIRIFNDDPNRNLIIPELAKRGKSLTILNNDCDSISFDAAGCPLLNNQGHCTIYQSKPKNCSDYPFGFVNPSIIALDSNCPPISEIYAAGIHSIFLSDIIIPISKVLLSPHIYFGNNPESDFVLQLKSLKDAGHKFYLSPLLGPALMSVIERLKSRNMPYNELRLSPLTSFEGEIVFIISK